MRKRNLLRNFLIASLTLALVFGGTASAFAKGDSHHDEKSHEKQQEDKEIKTKSEIKSNFKDLVQSKWAKKYIASLATKKIFEGYPDGTFQPNKPVSRIEAITAAVKLMGLKEQAEAKMNTDLQFKDGNKIEKKYPWAVGYVAVAVENDLFAESEDMIQPEKAADRLWATILLVKASKLNAEAMAKMNTVLDFTDAKQIPAGSVGYIAVAVEKGFVKGYKEDDGEYSFRPKKPITRVELAVLLDNTGQDLPEYNKDTLKGTVSVAVNANVMSIVLKDNSTKVLTLHPSAFIFRDGAIVAASAISVGDVVIVRSYNNIVYYVEVISKGSGTVDGSFTAADIKVQAVTKNTIKITALNNHTFSAADLNAFKFRNAAANTALSGVGNNDQLVNLGNVSAAISTNGQEIVLTTGAALSANAMADSNDEDTVLESLKLFIDGSGVKDQNNQVLTIAATAAVSPSHTNVADAIAASQAGVSVGTGVNADKITIAFDEAIVYNAGITDDLMAAATEVKIGAVTLVPVTDYTVDEATGALVIKVIKNGVTNAEVDVRVITAAHLKDANGNAVSVSPTSTRVTNVYEKVAPLAVAADKLTLAATSVIGAAGAAESGVNVKVYTNDADPAAAVAVGTITSAVDGSFVINGLVSATAYDVYVVDAAGNISPKLDIVTP